MLHAFSLCSQNIITLDHLSPVFMRVQEIERRAPDETQEADSHTFLEAQDKTAGDKTKAARLLIIDRVTLYRKIKRHNLTKATARRWLKCCTLHRHHVALPLPAAWGRLGPVYDAR